VAQKAKQIKKGHLINKKDKATNSLRVSCLFFVFLSRDIQQMSPKINKIDKESGFASGSSLLTLI
jgi:hypothetical protein